MLISIYNEIIDKAKLKNDGVYSHKGFRYAVKNKNLRFYYDGRNVCEVFGQFSTVIGITNNPYKTETLKKLLKDSN